MTINHPKSQRFEDVKKTVCNATEELKAKIVKEIKRYSKKRQDRWEHYIKAIGHYFEDDPFN